MSFASSRMSLLDIQNYFVEQMKGLHIISDLLLSEDDYRYLAAKVKMLFKFSNDNNVVDDYKLSIIVYWVYSMIYWDKENLGELEMDALFEGLPQYKKKYYMDVCMETFDEYEIYNYQVNYGDVSLYAKALIARHAGIPLEEQDRTFDVIGKYLECNLVAEMVESIMMELPERTQTIFCCFDDKSKQKVILDLRNLMIVCMKGKESKEELMKQYPYIAGNVIQGMRQWCNRQQELMSLELS